MLDIPEKNSLFAITDTHFCDNSSNQEIKDFFSFLELVREKGDKLFLLGDIFDFYFEYKSLLPKSFFEIFCELKKTSKEGLEIHYWPGNHDFWVGDFVRNLGIIIHSGPEIINIGNRKILVQHGDEMDSKFMLKVLLKNRALRTIFSWIHPEAGFALAKRISRFSRTNSKRNNLNSGQLKNYAEKKFREGIDAILMGHLHLPYFYEKDDKILAILGDWLHYRSFGIISNGKISLRRFNQSPR